MSEIQAGTPTESDQPVTFLRGAHPVPAPFAADHPAPPSAAGPRPTLPLVAGERATGGLSAEAVARARRALDSRVGMRLAVGPEDEPAKLDATSEWPAPDPAEFAEEDTDPRGFAPVSGAPYPPATDPFDDPGFTSAYPLPGWTAPPGTEPAPAAARARRPVLPAVAAVVGLAGLIAAFLLVPRGEPTPTGAAPAEAARQAPAGDNGGGGDNGEPGAGGVVTAARGGLDAAAFDILDSATVVQLSAADLGDDLYRVSTPAGSGLTPSAEQSGGTVKLRLRSDGRGGSAAVTIQLSSAVRWTLRLDGGTARSRLDLTGADLAALDLNGGAGRIDLALPSPQGLLPVRMTGGVDQFRVTLAGTTPVRVRVQSGAGQVTLDGTTHKGIAPGRSFTSGDWSGTAGIDLLAVAGLSALTVSD
ncbi:hypothetical protein [Actinoplanes sp. NPDC020271]|uniref:hypothetical protein n=1 Tax=Actinoplanes sp. NPDC020271 TaxID=3363896 RepID=UPI00378D3B16